MTAEVVKAKARMDQAANADPWSRHQAEAEWRRVSDLLARWSRPADPTPVEVEVQALRIGDMAIFAMPGEPFAEIGAAVKKNSPFPVTMFCGYSTGKGGGYMPVESEYGHGGYEVEMTPYGLGAAKAVIDGASGIVRKLR